MRKKSPSVDESIAAIVKARLLTGEMQHDIAASFGINQGRISEIKTGKIFAHVPPAAL